MQKELNSRAIVYLNVDASIVGNYTFFPLGTHSLRDIVFDAAKKVMNPNKEEYGLGRRTVYDTWFERENHGADVPL